jgi:hypothetical protein
MSQQISRSRSRLLGLESGVETKSRLLDRQDKLFESVKIFSTVETYFFLVSRQIETPRANNKTLKLFKDLYLINPDDRLVGQDENDAAVGGAKVSHGNVRSVIDSEKQKHLFL